METTITRGWIDTSGKTRTWLVQTGTGETLAEVTRRYQAERLQALLTQETQPTEPQEVTP